MGGHGEYPKDALCPGLGEAKVRVQGRECIVKVSPADEDYEAIGGIQARLDFASGCQWNGVEECLFEVNWCFGFGFICPCRAAFFRSRKNQWRV
jgi:hypothetical protein